MSLNTIAQHVSPLAESIYHKAMEEFGLPSTADVAASNKCHTLTIDLARALVKSGVTMRRELHASPDYQQWHYVIAYGPEPSPDEIITDMNPALGVPGMFPRHFHGPRSELQRRLRRLHAPEDIIAIRGIETVVDRHHMDLLPPFYGTLREGYIKKLQQS